MQLTLDKKIFRAEGVKQMKQGIHPKFENTKVHCVTCGNEFETGSTKKELRVDSCSKCHPFYTGKQKHTTIAGRVDKFNKKYGLKSEEDEE